MLWEGCKKFILLFSYICHQYHLTARGQRGRKEIGIGDYSLIVGIEVQTFVRLYNLTCSTLELYMIRLVDRQESV